MCLQTSFGDRIQHIWNHINILEEKNVELEKRMVRIESEKEAMKTQNENVLEENRILQTKVEHLVGKNEELQKINNLTTNQNNLFLREHQQIQETLSQINKNISLLSERQATLKPELRAVQEKAENVERDFYLVKGTIAKMANQLQCNNQTVEAVKLDFKNLSEKCQKNSVKGSSDSEDDSSSEKSCGDMVQAMEELKYVKHEEMEIEEVNLNKQNSKNVFFRISNTIMKSEYPKSEIARLLREWTNEDLSTTFLNSVAKIKPIKIEPTNSLFIIVLKKNQISTFKDEVQKNRKLLIRSPILIRSDISEITRLKKSILGMISNRLRVDQSQVGKKASCQKRFDVKARLHYLAPGEEKPAIYSYKTAIEKFKNLLSEEEIKEAYKTLRRMPEYTQRAILLL